MNRETIVETLKRHETALRADGIGRVALFGSRARGDNTDQSDIDLFIRLTARREGFAYFGQLDELNERLESILQMPVDLVVESSATARLKERIKSDEIVAFE